MDPEIIPQSPVMQTHTEPPPVAPAAPRHVHKNNSVLGIGISIVLLFSLGVIGFLFYQNQQLKRQLLQSQPEPVTVITPEPTSISSATDNWILQTAVPLSITFQLPPAFSLLDLSGKEITGETGKQFCMLFTSSTVFQFIQTIHAGSGACGGEKFTIGSVSKNYSAGRGGGFGDYTGYEKKGSQFFARFVNTVSQTPLQEQSLVEKTNEHGVTYLRIIGENTGDTPVNTLPKGYIGALINIKNPNYNGFNIAMKISSPSDEMMFDQILSTLSLADTTPKVPADINSIFSAINLAFNSTVIPTKETQFYSLQNGFINKESWKMDLSALLTDKSQFAILFNTLEKNLKQDVNSAADGVGQSIQGYENDRIYCFLLRGFNSSDYITCVEK